MCDDDDDDDEFYGNAIRLYFSSKCKNRKKSLMEKGVFQGWNFWDLGKPSKTSTKNPRKKKRQQNRTAKKRKHYFMIVKSGSRCQWCWADKFLNEKLEIAGENEEFVLQDPK
jgi:hypothetical protein